MHKQTTTMLCALALAGCAAALQANKRQPGAIENGAFKPSRPPAASYGPAEPGVTCPEAGMHILLKRQLEEKNVKPAPQMDGRLCAIADTLLGWQAENNELPQEPVRAFLSHYFGLPMVFRALLITNVETEDNKLLADAMTDPIVNFSATAQKPLYGVMTERVKKGVTRAVLVMIDENFTFDPPVPRKLAPGQTVTMTGHALPAIKQPKAEVVDVVGKLTKSGEPKGQDFSAELKCGDKPGKLLVQVIGDVEGSDTLLANFPVACGTEQPVAVKLPPAGGTAVDPAQAEARLLELINKDRDSAGLKPLQSNQGLVDIARDISTRRAQGKGTSSSDLQAALKQKEIRAPMLLESAAQVLGGADEAYDRFSESPSDRSNAMNPDMTEIGIGISKGPEVGGKPTIIATALYVKQLPPADPVAIKSKLYDAINKKRADAKAGEVTKDTMLADVAQKYADAAAASGGTVPKDKEAEILAPLYKQSMSVNELGGFTTGEEMALEIAEQPSITGNAKLVGVGVAVGNSPQFGKGAPFVMVLMGTRHEAPAKAGKKTRKVKTPPPPPPPRHH